MRKFGLLLALIVSFGLQAQKVTRFSSFDAFSEEFDKLVSVPKELDGVFKDSLVPNFLAAVDFEKEELWLDYANQLLRKRLDDAQTWEPLLRALIYVAENEEYDRFGALLEHFYGFSKKNPSSRIRSYQNQFYRNLVKHEFSEPGELVWKAPASFWTLNFIEGEPQFTMEMVDIVGLNGGDSTMVMGVNAVFYPQAGLLKANGGTIIWSREGQLDKEVYAELGPWTLQVNQTNFKADSVTLFATEFYDEPLQGVLEERVSSVNLKDARFPKFTSYRDNFVLENIYPDVHFKGGLGVAGAQFYGTAADSALAALKFTYKLDTVLTLKGRSFIFKDSLLSSKRVEVIAHLGVDSIYHPYCEMRFDPRMGQVRVIRYETGLGLASFTDSYHALNMSVDQLVWNQGTPILNFKNLNLGSEQAAIFESKQYFRVQRMEEIAGLQKNHPLRELRDAAYGFGYEDMPLKDLTYALRMAPEEGEFFLYHMAIQGFVTFDVDAQTISLTDRLFEYILNWEGKRDYDVIQFVSRIPTGNNAQVSLLNYQMDIAGISRIVVSDSQEVNLYPRGGRITVNEGMDFDFDGRINAGLFSYWGQGYSFDYDYFKIDMPQVDSMRFKVKEFNPKPGERAALVNVQTVLQDLQGQLLIDQPDNKSSKEYHPEYPIFQALNNSFVYYDHPRIHGGVYERSAFYMALEPFTIDSLDNTTTDGILFDATFHSADIFPVFAQPLSVMPDYSLGFETQMPATPAYKASGTYTGSLSLSNQGLHAEGALDYLQSRTVCPDILFFPLQASGRAATFAVEESTLGMGYPYAAGTSNPFVWMPYEDYIRAETRETPFALYGSPEVAGEGSLTYGGRGMFGTGELRYGTAKHNSEVEGYQFFRRSFVSADQDFRVKTKIDDEQWAFQMLASSAEVDFDKQEGVFDKLDPYSTLEFPSNQYMAYMDHAEWDMAKATVDIKHTQDNQAYLVSTHPRQDSLDFTAAYARFALAPSTIEAFEVPQIDVADASIYPDSGYVVIRINAEMDPLEHSTILADRFTKLHNFYETTARIRGKYRYTAHGMYDYLDEEENTWPIAFESIAPDSAGITLGRAIIDETDEFYISPYFAYRGKVELHADQLPMYFMGSILIQHDCRNLQTTWFDIASIIDPNDIVIELPFNDPNKLSDNTFNGVYISQDSLGGHSNFLSKYADRADIEVLSADGILYYDRQEQGYVVTTYEKLKDFTLPDPYLIFHNYDCDLYGTGPLKVLENTGAVTTALAGAVRHDLVKDEVSIDGVMTMNAPLDEKAWEAVAQLFNDGSGSLRSDETAYIDGIYALLGQKDGGEFLENIGLHENEGKFPRFLRQTLVLSEVNLSYSGRYKSFISEGTATIQNIYNQPVFAEVSCLIEVKERRRGGEIILYLDNGTDYLYLSFKGIVMSIRSSDEAFNQGILEKDAKDRSVKAKGDAPAFTYNLAGKGKIMLLKRRFGIEE